LDHGQPIDASIVAIGEDECTIVFRGSAHSPCKKLQGLHGRSTDFFRQKDDTAD